MNVSVYRRTLTGLHERPARISETINCSARKKINQRQGGALLVDNIYIDIAFYFTCEHFSENYMLLGGNQKLENNSHYHYEAIHLN